MKKILLILFIFGLLLTGFTSIAAELICDNVLSNEEKTEMEKYVIDKDMSSAEVKDCTQIGYTTTTSEVRALTRQPESVRNKWSCTACFYNPEYWSCAEKGN